MTKWREDQSWPRECVFAIGVVALNYGLLETLFLSLFTTVLNIEEKTAGRIFERIGNDARENLVEECLKNTELSTGLRSDVEHFIKGFHIAAANRNILMHSSHGGVIVRGEEESLRLTRRSRAGIYQELKPSLAELRKLADDIEELALFGALLEQSIRMYRNRLSQGRDVKGWQEPSPDRQPCQM
jgi:hypothetical protein